jgi:hypothetical protein
MQMFVLLAQFYECCALYVYLFYTDVLYCINCCVLLVVARSS